MGYIGQAPANKAVKTADIEDSAITAAKIADGTVVAGELASDSVTTAKILNANVTTAKLAADAVDGTKLADDAVNSEHYTDGSIDNAHIADDQIDSEHYAAGSIDLEHMSSESVDEDNLHISNAGTNGQALTKQSGNSGGLTWADAGGAADNYFASSGLSNKDLGTGLHIKISDTSASVNSGADALVLEDNGGDMGMSILSSTSGQGRIEFGDSGNNAIGGIKYDHGDNSMRLYANDAERMRINFALGDTNFFLGCTATPDGGDRGFAVHSQIMISGSSSTGEQDVLRIEKPGGRVGKIFANNSSTGYATSSDYRLKENETSITDGIDRVKQLKPYRFNWKVSPDETQDGFFAHEVSDIVPEAITGEKDAMLDDLLYKEGDVLPEGKNIGDVKKTDRINPQAIDQAKLVPLLTSALQEAITKIETLEAKVTALENA